METPMLNTTFTFSSLSFFLHFHPLLQVGNKADLERSRVLQTSDGCDLAVEFGAKFTETSPGMGHHIDELLVGIVMQMR